jgi:hypothetical protein
MRFGDGIDAVRAGTPAAVRISRDVRSWPSTLVQQGRSDFGCSSNSQQSSAHRLSGEIEQARIILLHWSGPERASRRNVADASCHVPTMRCSHLASGTHRAARGAGHRIARANRQKSGSATGLVYCDRLSLIPPTSYPAARSSNVMLLETKTVRRRLMLARKMHVSRLATLWDCNADLHRQACHDISL